MALTKTQVSQLYVSLFGRASETEGNTHWQAQTDMAAGADAMLATTAATEYFGGTLDDKAFVEYIYLNTLSKTYADDASGIDFWTAALATNTRGQVVAELIKSAVSIQDTAPTAASQQFANRVEVSNYTADTLAKAPADYATSTAFASANKPAGALTVTNDTTTVATAKGKIDEVNPDHGETFVLTTGADTFVGTAKNDLFDASTKGTLTNNDVILDSTTTDADILNATVTTAGVNARIQNVETVNITGEYVTAGLALTNVSGTNNLNVNTNLSGGTATVTDANSVSATNINAGANISTLKVTSLSSGTRDAVNVDAGNANVEITGQAGGADKYTVTIAADKTLTAATMNGAGDTLEVNAKGNLTLDTDAQGIETATLTNSSASSITITTNEAATIADKLKLSGNDIVLKATQGTEVDGIEITSDASSSTVELVAGTSVDLSKAVVDTVLASNTLTTGIKINEGSKLVLSKDQTALTLDIDNAKNTLVTGTLLLNVNATQTALTTGAKVDTLFVTAGALDNDASGNSQTVKLTDIITDVATNTVVVSGANDLEITTFTGKGDETIVATSMTGKLTIGEFIKDTIVYGGNNDDTFTLTTTGIKVDIKSGAGNDTIDLSAADTAGSKVEAGAGNDIIKTSGNGDVIDAGAGDDTVTLNTTSTAADTVTLGTGSDTVIMSSVATRKDIIKDFTKGTDTLVLTGAAAAAIDLTKLTAPTANKYTLDSNFIITLTGVTATDLSDSIQLGNATAEYEVFANASVVAGAKDDVMAIATGTNSTITTGAGADTVILNGHATTTATATITDFTVGTDKVILTGAATTAGTVTDLTKATLTTAHAITLKNAGTEIALSTTDLSTMVQLGTSATDTYDVSAQTSAVVTGGIFDDFITVGGSTVNFIDNGGMDTILGFTAGGATDTLSFTGMTGITGTGTAVAAATNATDGAVYIMTADTKINGDTIDYSKLTSTSGNQVNDADVTLTDASVMDDVAAYINNAIAKQVDGEKYVVVINDDNNNDAYAYLVNVDADGIDAANLSLIGVVKADADVVAADIA